MPPREPPQAFLWDSSQPEPGAADFVPVEGGWWNQYYAHLAAGKKLSARALEELTASSRAIVGLLPRPGNWTRPRPFKGVVVGAVQSGKTQSMMGVAATALDNGYRLVVVLAGLKDDLRTQTARRFNTDLLRRSDPVPGVPGGTTLGKPPGAWGEMKGFAPPYNVDCPDYAPLLPKLLENLRAGKPCVVTIKKTPTSVTDLAATIQALLAQMPADSVPMLVLDDECDEATVPGGAQEQPVPEAILSLWRTVGETPPVAYVGYTATAAANLLQHPDWPLYPHWVYLLRYAGSSDSRFQFQEAATDRWYSGGDCFYGDFGEDAQEASNFLVRTTVTDQDLAGPPANNPSLKDAVRAFLVGAAYRLALQPGKSLDDPKSLSEKSRLLKAD